MTDKLLPNYYKKIGLTVAGVSLFLLIINTPYLKFYNFNPEILDWILKDIILVALLMIAFAKEKVESRKITEIRFNKLKQSVIFGGFVLIMDSLSQIVIHSQVTNMKDGFYIMIMILLFYLITFNFRKFRLNPI